MSFITNFIKQWFRNLIVLLALARFYPGFSVPANFISQLITAFILTTITIFLQPILKMLVLPVNIITFGMFTWLLEALILLLLTLVVDGVAFQAFSYQTFTVIGVSFPSGQFNIFMSIFFRSIIFKFLISLITYLSSD